MSQATPSPRLREVLSSHVQRGEPPGLVALVQRAGDANVEILGDAKRDTLFRIASMTKPITATAAMILVEEGKLKLDEPVDGLLPELSKRRVLKRLDGPLDDTVPAQRPIHVRDLLSFTFGFGIIWGPPDATPIQRAAEALKLGAFGPPRPMDPPEPDEWMRRFATLPLMHPPGDHWMYNTGAEVLGVLIARAVKKPFDVFLRERIFEPLGMTDTGFWVPPEKIQRLPTSYMAKDPFHPDGSGLTLYDPSAGGQWSKPPPFPSGGAGLVSTVDDYLAFSDMLMGKGTRGKVRILSAASVEAMSRDQLTAEQKANTPPMPGGFWDNHGWGYGMAVVTGPGSLTGGTSGYGWDGGLGTSWFSDPARAFTGILLTQRSAFPPMTSLYRDFWKVAATG